MDPATIAMAAVAINDISTAIQQYSAGQITQDQAHQQFVAAFSNLQSAIAQFRSAGSAAPPAA